MSKCFFDDAKLPTKNISICCFSATQGLNFCCLLIIFTPVEKLIITFSGIKGCLYTSLYVTNQAPYVNMYVLSLVYFPLFW